MELENFLTIDKFDSHLEWAQRLKFSGTLNVDASGVQKWSLYFITGQLIWVKGGTHCLRRWRRFLYQYCPHIPFQQEILDLSKDYYLIVQWVEKGQLMAEQAKVFIKKMFEEVFFDILKQEQQGILTFTTNDKDRISSCLIQINPEQMLKQAQDMWEQWHKAGLAHISPDWAPSIAPSQQISLQKQAATKKIKKELLSLIDGDKSLREISLLLKQPLISVTSILNFYFNQGLIEMRQIKDLSSSHSCIPLSININTYTFDEDLSFSTSGVLCNHCGYVANPINTSKCQICSNSLDNNLTAKTLLNGRQKSRKSLVWLVSGVLALIMGGSYLAWNHQNQILSSKSDKLVPAQSTNLTKLTLLGDSFSGYSTFRNSEFQKALKENGVGLHYADQFDQAKRAASLNRGEADLLVTSLDQFILQQPQGKIVGIIDHTAGADAVVLNSKRYPNLKSLQDLSLLASQMQRQGKQLKIVFAGGTPSEYLALLLSTKFDAFDLSKFHVHKVADASDAWRMLKDDRDVAVAVLWQPFIAEAEAQGNRVVLSSKDVPGAIVDVIVASDSLLQRPEPLGVFTETYYRRIDANLLNNSQFRTQIIEDSNLTSKDVTRILEGIKFFSAKEAKKWLNDGTLERRIGSTAAVLTLSGTINRPLPNTKSLYTPVYIEQAVRNTETLLSLLRADRPDLAKKLLGQDTSTPSQVSLDRETEIGALKVRGEVKFQEASATLTPESIQTLDRLAKEIAEFNPKTLGVRVIGHTSKFGSADLNQKLSQERSQQVVNYLRSRGLEHQIVAEGKGFSQPIGGTSPNDPANQRTEIQLIRINN